MKSKEAVCSSRERYWSEEEAYAAASNLSEEHHYRSPALRAYICHECIGWHLTTQSKQSFN
jgi:hypothetical protein